MITLIYSSQSKMAKVGLKKVLDKDHPERNEYNYVSFDMSVTPVSDLIKECEAHSLSFENKAVVAENCDFLEKAETKKKKKDSGEEKDAFLEYVLNPDPSTDLYLLLYVEEPDFSKPVLKAIKEKHTLCPVANLSPAEWISYIKKYFGKRNFQIDDETVNEIYTRTNGDYAFFINEASKLVAFKADDPKIELSDVYKLVPPRVEEDTFKLSNCLTSGDVNGAIKIYKDLKFHSTDEVTLIGMLATQFIFYDKVKYLDSKGLDVDRIAMELGQKNSKRVYVTLKNIRKLTSFSIEKILEQLYQAETDIFFQIASKEFIFSRFLANFTI